MPDRILLISDLHLQESRSDITGALLGFLELNAGNCSALYILGDLFEVWIGDDEQSELITGVAAALTRFADTGSAIYFLHGNRDFLIGEKFLGRCRAELINEPFVLDTVVGPVLLLHGDSLCVDDVEYMQFRKLVRQTSWQQEFLAKSLQERREFAARARQQSHAAQQGKDMGIMDVNQSAVMQLCNETGHTTLIHGHTHRPAVHDLTFNPPLNDLEHGRRIVLGDWDARGWFVAIDRNGIELHPFDFAN
ncbi:MAG: UDP-2,3-diacylglucosamine diphosphatase [Proteobacteria bacterium]|nr:UDP-2,3-diacylglucosamine diphosphatase [Pseudomonadota bacterium]